MANQLDVGNKKDQYDNGMYKNKTYAAMSEGNRYHREPNRNRKKVHKWQKSLCTNDKYNKLSDQQIEQW